MYGPLTFQLWLGLQLLTSSAVSSLWFVIHMLCTSGCTLKVLQVSVICHAYMVVYVYSVAAAHVHIHTATTDMSAIIMRCCSTCRTLICVKLLYCRSPCPHTAAADVYAILVFCCILCRTLICNKLLRCCRTRSINAEYPLTKSLSQTAGAIQPFGNPGVCCSCQHTIRCCITHRTLIVVKLLQEAFTGVVPLRHGSAAADTTPAAAFCAGP